MRCLHGIALNCIFLHIKKKCIFAKFLEYMQNNKTIFIRTDNQQFLSVISRLLSESWGWNEAYLNSFLYNKKAEKEGETEKISKFNQFFNGLVPNLIVCAENNYVDKVFRDSYYTYYASKAASFPRDCVKLSLFLDPKHEIEEGSEVGYKWQDVLEKKYRGFLVLRPTPPNIVGRSAISREIVLRKDEDKVIDFVNCETTIRTSLCGFKQSISAFPYSSQDGETITCAETTIWALMEYFGNKYPEYTPVLPSDILDLMKQNSEERQLPACGLTESSMSYIVKNCGFGPKLYHEKAFEDFNNILGCYIESGIPIIMALSNRDVPLAPGVFMPRHPKDTVNHAVLCIGREILQDEKINNLLESEGEDKSKIHKLNNGIRLFDYDDVERRFVFMDDNFPPYQLEYLNTPVTRYAGYNQWEGCHFTHFIAPLHKKVYLEPSRAKQFVKVLLDTKYFAHLSGKLISMRVFLCSTRSYRHYVNTSDMHEDMKRELADVYMPKFVWIVELSTPDKLKKSVAEGVMVVDATEFSTYNHMPLIASFSGGHFLFKKDGVLDEAQIDMNDFNMFYNLK